MKEKNTLPSRLRINLVAEGLLVTVSKHEEAIYL